ncbi:ExbD/TolR family protein [Akkermansia glycaniphila]|uniref:Biopolymer transport protein exbd/tolr n=1 Tax=Akkermansia glycaniphila TaxID=1679444 RepID=A0A1C7P969_9BACT|nr:biopolymer transporter ExbD [Akkermansia glycaniphila]OCA02018.1 hypothetical protein AC781_12545 [Akkermansia glycaniphila]SEH93343.1 biopolymer transport protein exbd/tolr [Akkermansia glycaniphila]
MGKKALKAADDTEASVDMSPMIDCCFLLLIFFVVNATAITVKKDKNVKMPTAVASDELKKANGLIVVNVFNPDKMKDSSYPAGTIWASDERKGFSNEAELEEYLKTRKEELEKKKNEKGQEFEEVRLYIRGDATAPYKYTNKVITAAGKNGITNIVFGALPTK